MLTQIKLTNFKCFKEETAIPLSKFNLFTGVNGAGKSTALQALLLMRQSVELDEFATELVLNGSCVSLGSFDDVRNRGIPKIEPIHFEFLYSHKQCNCSQHYLLKPKPDEMSLAIFQIDMNLSCPDQSVCKTIYYDNETGLYCSAGEDANQHGDRVKLNHPSFGISFGMPPDIANGTDCNWYIYTGFNFDIHNIHFISADRIGPQEFYLKSTLPRFRHVGTKGEFTVNLLDKLALELVNESLCLGDDARTIITQTQAWLGKILNPLKLEVPRSKTNILELFIGNFKPSNVGFGYTSILPIIVTGLIAKLGEKIIIENPEIHLHPKAQSALIEFLVKVANTGVQIFIESHSDHVLNALRIAVLKGQLTSEDANILYFQGNNQKTVQQIPIQKDGRIEEWPENFFDQIDNDFSVLFGV